MIFADLGKSSQHTCKWHQNLVLESLRQRWRKLLTRSSARLPGTRFVRPKALRLWRCVQWCAVMTWHGFFWKRRTPKFQSVFDVPNVCIFFFDKRTFRERLLTADWICQDQLCILKWSECASSILPFQFALAASKIVLHWRFFLGCLR